jgi:hypothetical protein
VHIITPRFNYKTHIFQIRPISVSANVLQPSSSQFVIKVSCLTITLWFSYLPVSHKNTLTIYLVPWTKTVPTVYNNTKHFACLTFSTKFSFWCSFVVLIWLLTTILQTLPWILSLISPSFFHTPYIIFDLLFHTYLSVPLNICLSFAFILSVFLLHFHRLLALPRHR